MASLSNSKFFSCKRWFIERCETTCVICLHFEVAIFKRGQTLLSFRVRYASVEGFRFCRDDSKFAFADYRHISVIDREWAFQAAELSVIKFVVIIQANHKVQLVRLWKPESNASLEDEELDGLVEDNVFTRDCILRLPMLIEEAEQVEKLFEALHVQPLSAIIGAFKKSFFKFAVFDVFLHFVLSDLIHVSICPFWVWSRDFENYDAWAA